MSRGAMTVIAPISAVVGLSIPVVIGLLKANDRKSSPIREF